MARRPLLTNALLGLSFHTAVRSGLAKGCQGQSEYRLVPPTILWSVLHSTGPLALHVLPAHRLRCGVAGKCGP